MIPSVRLILHAPGILMPAKPTVHRSHVVPKFYLRGFSVTDTDRVWVGDIRTQKCYLAQTTKVAVEKYFYAPELGEHEDDLELLLSDIESNAAPEMKAFNRGGADISPHLGRFIAWLAARTTWLRRVTGERFPDFLRANQGSIQNLVGLEKRPFEFEKMSSGQRVRISLVEALQRINDDEWRLHVTQDQHLDAIRIQAHLFGSEHFPKMKWVRATAPHGYCFVTSDKPVCWDVLGAGVGDSPATLRHPFAELTFALSSNRALVAGHDHSAILAGVWTVDEINRRTVAGAERFIYGSREEDIKDLLSHRVRDRFH